MPFAFRFMIVFCYEGILDFHPTKPFIGTPHVPSFIISIIIVLLILGGNY